MMAAVMGRMVNRCWLAMVLWAACAAAAPAQQPADPHLQRIGHIIVLYMENRSFDNLYGLFPGADGIANAGATAIQIGRDGQPLAHLPPILDPSTNPPRPDSHFPAELPNAPFRIEPFVPIDQPTRDLVHRFYQNQEQINGGAMNLYATVSDAGGLVMGYYDGSPTALWSYAQRYTLADHFFQGAFGGSFLNHFWLICACTPAYPDGPAALRAELDADGHLVRDGALTPDGFAVNTIQPFFTPYDARVTDPARRLPPQTLATIGDRLSERGISWAWYGGGWNDAVAGHPAPSFQFHHHPFAYFARYGDGTPDRAEHLRDGEAFLAAIRDGSLPAVSFYKPIGVLNQHPGYAEVASGDQHAAEILALIEHSPIWNDSVVIVTYDENGGFWDHVPPPAGDRWGPGPRIPTLIVSPFARHGYVDSTVYDTTSILRLIEERYGIPPLGERDAQVNSLARALTL